jgi:hypothetical protein
MAKKELIQLRGIASFPWLNTPDTKFEPDGVFRTKVRMPVEAATPIIERLEEIVEATVAEEQQKKKGKKVKRTDLPWQFLTDEDGEPTGDVEFSTKIKASGTREDGTKWTRKLAVFDARAKPCDAKVGAGSELIVSVEPRGFFVPALGAGVSLRLEGVQVLKLVEFGGKSADALGFTAHDDGYTVEADGAAEDEAADDADYESL